MVRRSNQTPLAEIVAARRSGYEARVTKAFQTVYSSGNLLYIDRFEQIVANLAQRVVQGNLEGIVIKPLESTQEQTQSGGKKQISYEAYRKARDSGKNHQQIAEQYSDMDSRKLSGHAGNYSRYKKAADAADPRPAITFELYSASRNAGQDNKQIKTQYKLGYPRQLNVFSMEYAKARKKAVSEAAKK